MGKIITNTKRIIPGNDLLERWTGILEEYLADMIDASNKQYSDDELPPEDVRDFPQCYWLLWTTLPPLLPGLQNY